MNRAERMPNRSSAWRHASAALAAFQASWRRLPRLLFGRGLILQSELTVREGFASAPATDRAWLGKRGTAASPLRPAGIADFEGERVDVVSDGGFIEAGEPVTAYRVDGNRIVVRALHRRG